LHKNKKTKGDIDMKKAFTLVLAFALSMMTMVQAFASTAPNTSELITTGITTLNGEIMGIIGIVIPIAVGIFAAKFGIKFAISFVSNLIGR